MSLLTDMLEPLNDRILETAASYYTALAADDSTRADMLEKRLFNLRTLRVYIEDVVSRTMTS